MCSDMPIPGDAAEDGPLMNSRDFHPLLCRLVCPLGYGDSSNTPPLTDQIGNQPSPVALLKMSGFEGTQLGSPQSCSDQERKDRPIATALCSSGIGRREQNLCLFGREPIPQTDSGPL